MVYVSCAACGWRGYRGFPHGDGFLTHVCCASNAYQANHADQREGWPNDRETHVRLGPEAMNAIKKIDG